jgi:hypothetical protein
MSWTNQRLPFARAVTQTLTATTQNIISRLTIALLFFCNYIDIVFEQFEMVKNAS